MVGSRVMVPGSRKLTFSVLTLALSPYLDQEVTYHECYRNN